MVAFLFNIALGACWLIWAIIGCVQLVGTFSGPSIMDGNLFRRYPIIYWGLNGLFICLWQGVIAYSLWTQPNFAVWAYPLYLFIKGYLGLKARTV
jgi:hypothetical protein